MQIIARMTPEHEAQDIMMRAVCPPSVTALACELQRAAFHGERDLSEPFKPAPLYLRQAFVLWEHTEVREAVIVALGDL